MKSALLKCLPIYCGLFFSCHEPNKETDEQSTLFNEGVAINLESIKLQDNGNIDSAMVLNRESIKKFRAVYQLDSLYPAINSALGHCLYVDGQFDEAFTYFANAIRQEGETAGNYREMGLCRINRGRYGEGKSFIDKAFVLDTSMEIRSITLDDLQQISDRAYQFSMSYKEDGNIAAYTNYKDFSVIILALTLTYNRNDKALEKKFTDLAKKTGNSPFIANYEKLFL